MTEKIRILRVMTRLNVGGPSRHVKILMDQLDATRFEQRLVVGCVPEGEIEHGAAAAHVTDRIPELGRSPSPLKDVRAGQALARLIHEYRPHVVHTHQAKAGILGRRAAARLGVPAIVHTYHGHTFRGYWSWPVQKLVEAAERRAARTSSALVAQSESQLEEIVQVLGEEHRKRMRLVPPAIDTESLDAADRNPSRLRADLGLTREACVLFLGRLAAVKNPASFLRVFARAQELGATPMVALIAGGGTSAMDRELHDLVDTLGLRASVRWLGYREDVATVLSLSDVCVSTSINEGTPLSLIEARYRGVPVAGFDVGGIKDILGGRHGVSLVDAGDEEGLAHAINTQLSEFSDQAGADCTADDLRREFGASRLTRELQQLYEELVVQ